MVYFRSQNVHKVAWWPSREVENLKSNLGPAWQLNDDHPTTNGRRLRIRTMNVYGTDLSNLKCQNKDNWVPIGTNINNNGAPIESEAYYNKEIQNVNDELAH